jgi:hypothetical protein
LLVTAESFIIRDHANLFREGILVLLRRSRQVDGRDCDSGF